MAEIGLDTPSEAVRDNQRSTNGSPVMHGGGAATDAASARAMWLTFAAVMLLCGALLNGFWGVAALAEDDRFLVDELLFGDLAVWGALLLGIAVLQLATAALLFLGSSWGAGLGIGLAVANMVAQFAAVGAYPVWSVILIVIDGLIIYGLCAYGFRRVAT